MEFDATVDFFFKALTDMFTVKHLFFLFLGTILGLLVGILPGLGGIAGLSVVLPFVFDGFLAGGGGADD